MEAKIINEVLHTFLKGEAEIHLNDEAETIELWDYREELGSAFYVKDLCKRSGVDIHKLIQLSEIYHFYYVI